MGENSLLICCDEGRLIRSISKENITGETKNDR